MSRSLGVLTLDLLLKHNAFSEGMTAAERKADKSLTAIEKRAHKFGQALGVGLKTAGVAAFGAMAAGLGIYIRNSIEAERVQAQLASRIKDTGSAAGRTLAQLNAQADKLQGMTIFDDEAIGGVQAMLLTFKQIQGVNFDDATGAVLDLATAMGTDANAAALQLGKALNDPIKGVTALGKAGVQFSVDQKAMIKSLVETGDIAGAQRVILKELEGQMGTAAEAARNTFGGALEGLKNSFNNLLEGDSGSDGLLAATEAVNDLAGAMNDPDVKQGVDNIVGGIASIVAECVQGIGALQRFGENVNTIFDISEKVSSGAPLTDFNDRELQVRLANLSTQKSNAKANGNKAEVDRLQKLITEAIREGTRRNIATLFDGVSISVDSTYDDKKPAATARPTGGTAKAGKSDAARQAEEAETAMRAAAEAQAEWHSRILDMSSDLAGPTAQVLRDYDKLMADLTGQFYEGKVRLDDYAKAQDLLAEIRDKDLQAINSQLTPYQEMANSLREEIELLGMSAEAQEVLIAQRRAGVEAMSAEGQELAGLVEMRQAAEESARTVEGFKDATEDLFASMIDGSKSAKDAFADFGKSVLQEAARVLAHKAVQSLFSMFSTSGMPTGATGDVAIGAGSYGGAAGGSWWSSLLSAFGGGGRAAGGTVKPWSIHPVNEIGMEGLTVNGKDYLMTGSQSGVVTPNNKLRGNNRPIVNQTIQVTGTVDPRSANQIAVETSRHMQIASARFR